MSEPSFTGEDHQHGMQSSVPMALGELRVMVQMVLRGLAENKGEIENLYAAMRRDVGELRSYVHNRFDVGERRIRELEQSKSTKHEEMERAFSERIRQLETQLVAMQAQLRPRLTAPQILAAGASVCAILAFIFLIGSKLGWSS